MINGGDFDISFSVCVLRNTVLCVTTAGSFPNDDVSHCQILSPDKTEWRLISDADEDAVLWLTSYGSWNAYEKKYIWTRRHIYDNLHVLSTDDANMFTRKQYHTTWTLITDVRLQTISLTNLDYTSFSRAVCSTCVVGNLMGHWELHTQWPEYF